ncbi:MAG: ATP-binding protein [Micrococcales bacterium]|nr:MAG: ATP-binding protein [Micrococcales bacterium]PIE26949.1 MAG: ATP-binding protein [Micrococcales bacterium]
MSSLFRCSAASFSQVEAHLADRLAEQMVIRTGRRPAQSEQRSWVRSLPVLVADLQDADRTGVELLVEYRLPLTSKRADVVLAGLGARTGKPAYLVVELKQWTFAERFEDSDTLVRVEGYGRPVLHPGEQVQDYCEYLQNFVAVLADDPDAVAGAAYLHNATDLGVADLLERPGNALSRLFTGQRRSEFRRYLASYFAPQSGADPADLLEGSRVAPSKQLMAVAAEEVQRRESFVLLDEQHDAFEYVRHVTASARRQDSKTAVIVSGGPGSGKSVIALSLMGHLARQGRTVVHATGSQSFTRTLRKVAAKGSPRVRKAFQYFNSFMEADPNDIDVLILDEAHRIRQTSANRFTKKSLRSGRAQIDELFSAARTPVFLLDENQVVRPGELGTVADISAAAAARGIDVLHVRLDDQFRCGGSLAYVQWVERLLGLAPGNPTRWQGDSDFAVFVAQSPEEMELWLESRREAGYSARMSAGYCWPWSDPNPDGTLVADVQIGNWARPWNLKGDRAIGGAPPSALWATDPAGFAQVGCVYTAQGFEYDYAGVIIGPDLVYRDGEWVVIRDANKDPAFRNRTSVPDCHFDRLVRNVYKVLLTRGMQGVAIYSSDRRTSIALNDLVAGSSRRDPVLAR